MSKEDAGRANRHVPNKGWGLRLSSSAAGTQEGQGESGSAGRAPSPLLRLGEAARTLQPRNDSRLSAVLQSGETEREKGEAYPMLLWVLLAAEHERGVGAWGGRGAPKAESVCRLVLPGVHTGVLLRNKW